ncbi:MAG TPA: AraC family transcriptional regulator [Mobilitalea sp.]|nr:AraC family transcriptional regulator [Mobilitalea sp.]
MIEKLNGTRETVVHPDIPNVRVYYNTEVENYPMHWHTDIEVIMAVENIYTIIINKKTYVLNPGDIIMIPSGEIHELYAPPTGRRIIILFDNSILNNLSGIDSINNGFYPCIVIRSCNECSYYSQVVKMLEQMTDEYYARPPLCEASIYSMSMYLFVMIGRNCISQDQPNIVTKKLKQHQYIDKFLSVCKYINEHCTEDITVDELATLAGFSKYHFSRLFYNFSGATYYDYLMKRRIMYAEALLCDPNLSIVEIAMQSGFNSLATFNRNFRDIRKCTPSEYRSMYSSQLY